ncbi:MAG: diguanylate phosphodiesterase [Sulfurimonas sp. RIFOXYD12_FULL_33_39]|uniref:EAL and HDOD domain-containing protein n=1 Tax=unclassified Sulfurimonas TaxID=2623549 RepID=UPI0008C84976|nr:MULTISPECIES: EAL domain-containing protein [unclassified Sulfurimonas]OHE06991.1 MAG: diguanylate phosphodiesterase [Sulfurimonas sp. RIFCSPLOWO2_12_FULL_34_6]OHE08907.1 MAG: diguanylate phosphodiesterase [Sulfurimonas sp. RIFOXYD12_FULL_33_39]OHE14217.1 MAG: diguanylate phosphodiesterase [Sulfurimonas sp. RIFOXYD2_FULL_34_21]
MNNVFMARQKIFSKMGTVHAHELLFRDHAHGIKEFPSNIKATSHVIINSLTNISAVELLGKDGIGFVNIDETILTSDILDVLDKEKFVLELLETIELNDKVIKKIKQYHARGFKIAIDDFDCSGKMIKKFLPLFKYIYMIKIDVLDSEPQNLVNVVEKLKKTGIKLLAEKIETKEEYNKYIKMGFDFFQGYYLHKPEVLEINRYKESTQIVILQLIKIIRQDGQTSAIEAYIKQQPDLSYKLLKFLNNQTIVSVKIESITQIITLLGRDKLLRWLMVYIYSEISNNPASELILKMATKRAERMEADALPADKDKAYLAGMFSLLDAIFETDIKDLMKYINLDKDITSLVIEKKGKFASSFLKAEKSERDYLKKLIIDNFDKINTVDIIYALGFSGVEIDKSKL